MDRWIYSPCRVARRLIIALVGLLALGPGASTAGAVRSPPSPLAIAGASVTQSGQDVAWTVTLTARFSPSALSGADRSLCLLIERRDNGSATGQLCVLGPRPGGRSPRLAYQPIMRAGPGAATVIAATVTRPAGRGLTAVFLPAAIGNSYRSLRWQVLSRVHSGGCATATGDAAGCVALFPSRPALAVLHTPRLVGCSATGPDLVYDEPSRGREIALTFDDGPWYQTPQFLDLLEHDHVPATFFQIGRQISEYGEGGAIERRMLADGDMIGDHTWSHPDVAGAGAFAQAEIEEAAAAIRTATGGFTPCLFRAPYGDLSPALLTEARSLGFTTIQWNIDPRDWAPPGVGEIESDVIDNAQPGAIVEMHDGGGDRSETLAALPDIIDTLRGRGYTFVTVTQLLGQRLIYR
jgi:peptidoglycan-N-acetylglucosamine deacetylase